jgi:hypothetical protein
MISAYRTHVRLSRDRSDSEYDYDQHLTTKTKLRTYDHRCAVEQRRLWPLGGHAGVTAMAVQAR